VSGLLSRDFAAANGIVDIANTAPATCTGAALPRPDLAQGWPPLVVQMAG